MRLLPLLAALQIDRQTVSHTMRHILATLLLLVVSTPLAAQTTTTTQPDNPRGKIIANVKSIAVPGIPGPLSIFDRAFVVGVAPQAARPEPPKGPLATALAAGEWNRPTEIAIWDVATQKRTGTLKHPGEVLGLAVSQDGKFIAAGGGDKTISVWTAK